MLTVYPKATGNGATGKISGKEDSRKINLMMTGYYIIEVGFQLIF